MVNNMHENTKWIMAWADRMNDKFGQPDEGYDWIRNLSYVSDEAGDDHPSQKAINLAMKWEKAKFGNTSCSQCGEWFGPGEHGFSHCKDHHNKSSNIDLLSLAS